VECLPSKHEILSSNPRIARGGGREREREREREKEREESKNVGGTGMLQE
jgi:hypothetical protein